MITNQAHEAEDAEYEADDTEYEATDEANAFEVSEDEFEEDPYFNICPCGLERLRHYPCKHCILGSWFCNESHLEEHMTESHWDTKAEIISTEADDTKYEAEDAEYEAEDAEYEIISTEADDT